MRRGPQKGIANAYSNLGNCIRIRGDLTQAEAMYRKALELSETLGYKKGMAMPTATWASCMRSEGT